MQKDVTFAPGSSFIWGAGGPFPPKEKEKKKKRKKKKEKKKKEKEKRKKEKKERRKLWIASNYHTYNVFFNFSIVRWHGEI